MLADNLKDLRERLSVALILKSTDAIPDNEPCIRKVAEIDS